MFMIVDLVLECHGNMVEKNKNRIMYLFNWTKIRLYILSGLRLKK